ncbi:MAG: hypothetical protein AB7G75_35165 [Candidatus Binatia bacterium]
MVRNSTSFYSAYVTSVGEEDRIASSVRPGTTYSAEVGLAWLQNDCLLALTARYTGAVFLTADGHFDVS